jgi:hypothetical protein
MQTLFIMSLTKKIPSLRVLRVDKYNFNNYSFQLTIFKIHLNKVKLLLEVNNHYCM